MLLNACLLLMCSFNTFLTVICNDSVPVSVSVVRLLVPVCLVCVVFMGRVS